jgi:hypothetical protein
MALAHVGLALALAIVAPLPLLLLSPLLLGVPHVFGDLRHLVLSPPKQVARSLWWPLMLPLGGLAISRMLYLTGGPIYPRLELLLGLSAIALGVLLAPAASTARRGAWLLLVALLVAPVVFWPGESALLVGHAHNLVAVGVWTAFAGWHGVDERRWSVLVAVGFSVALLLLAPAPPPDASFAGLTLLGLSATLAPDLAPETGARIVRAFAMLQAVHYSMWLWCIDDARQPAPTPPSVRWRAWASTLGGPLVVVAVLGSVTLPALGWVDPPGARGAYLSLVLFHGWLELAILSTWFVGRPE